MQDFGEFALKVAESGDSSDMMAYTTAETAAVDAALKKVRSQAYQADAGKVSKGGDTMTGTLRVNTQPPVNAQIQVKCGSRDAWYIEQDSAGDFHLAQVGRPGGQAVALAINNISHQATFRTDLTVGGQLHLGNVSASSAVGTGYLTINNGTVRYQPLQDWINAVNMLVAASSQRYKQNITPADDVPDVARLSPKVFRWREDSPVGAGDGRDHLGLIAEEAAAVDPRLAAYDEDGQVHGLDTFALIAALVDKVQKLEARIEQFEAGS